MLEKIAGSKGFEYSLLGSELKKQTDIAKKQYQGLDKIFSSNKDSKHLNESLIKEQTVAKKLPKKTCPKSNLIFSIFSFYSYSHNEKFDSLSFKSKYSKLLWWFQKIQLDKTNRIKQERRKSVWCSHWTI